MKEDVVKLFLDKFLVLASHPKHYEKTDVLEFVIHKKGTRKLRFIIKEEKLQNKEGYQRRKKSRMKTNRKGNSRLKIWKMINESKEGNDMCRVL